MPFTQFIYAFAHHRKVWNCPENLLNLFMHLPITKKKKSEIFGNVLNILGMHDHK